MTGDNEQRMASLQTRFLYGHLPKDIVAGLVIATLAFIHFGYSGANPPVYLWISALLLLSCVKAGLMLWFFRNESALAPAAWERLLVGMAFLSGALYGAPEFNHIFGFTYPDRADIFFSFVVFGMCAAMAAGYSANIWVVAAFLTPALGPMMYTHLFYESLYTHEILSATAILYYALLLSLARSQNSFVKEAQDMRRERTAMAKALMDNQKLLQTQSAILENIAEGVMMVRSSDEVIAHTNPKFDSLFGYDPGELYGKHVSILNAPGSPGEMAAKIKEAILAHGDWTGQIKNIKKDGAFFWTEATVTRHKDSEHGDVMLTVQRDISDSKKLNDKLKESEVWHRALFENGPDPIFIADSTTGILLKANRAGLNLVMKTSQELIGRHQVELHPEKYRELARQRFKDHPGSMENSLEETYLLRSDGAEIPVEVSAQSIILEGRPAVQGVFRDITERKKAERELSVFKRFAMSSSQAFAFADPEGKIAYVNSAAMAILKEPSEEIYMKTLFDYLGEEERARMKEEVIPKVINKGSWRGEMEILLADGVRTPTMQSFSCIKDPFGKIIYISSAFSDISSIKLTERKLVNAKMEAEEATVLKDKFVSLVAHDLKSPISTISSLNQLLMDDKEASFSSLHREILMRTSQSCHHMLSLIDNLLDLSRLKNGAMTPKPVFFLPCDLVSMELERLAFIAERKSVLLVNDIPSRFRIFADVTLFRQALENLITNAIKFACDGCQVRILARAGPQASVIVEDNGVGMTPAQVENIVTNNSKASTPGTAGEKGSGLGLSYVKEILNSHGGRLRVESEPGKGSRFYMDIPHVRPYVLVVDDEPAILRLVSSCLDKQNFETKTADSAGQALEIMASGKVTIGVLDLSMPGTDGFELIGNIRRDMLTKNIPLIVVTSSNQPESRERALKLGADDFMSKPIDLDALTTRINHLILFRNFGWE